MVKEELRRFRKVGMLEQIYYVRPDDPAEDYIPEDTPLTETTRNVLVRGSPASLSTSAMAPLCRPGLRVREAVTDWGSLTSTGMITLHLPCPS